MKINQHFWVIPVVFITYLFGCSMPIKQEDSSTSLKALSEADLHYTLAINEFDKNLKIAFSTNEPNLQKASHEAANKLSNYNSCLKIVSLMAWDKVFSKNETEAYFQEMIIPILSPANNALSQDINAAILKLNEALLQNAKMLASDSGSLGESLSQNKSSLNLDLTPKVSSSNEFNNYSTEVFKVSSRLAIEKMKGNFEIDSVTKKRILKPTAKLFAKPVTKLLFATNASRVPLAVGQVIAVISAGSSAYDIYALQRSFNIELNELISQSELEQVNTLKFDLEKFKTESFKQYKELQSNLLAKNKFEPTQVDAQ